MTRGDFPIPDLISGVEKGNIRIPAFQREFVWDCEDIAFLMDSIYKGYPFGTIQLWRSRSRLLYDRKVGVYEIPQQDDQFPIDYVLDGQQRVTSIFGVFQRSLDVPEGEKNPFAIYFDLDVEPNRQYSQFVHIPDDNYDKARYFPLNVIFNSAQFMQACENIPPDKRQIIHDLYQTFLQARIPYQSIETDDKAKVSIVFERINRKGIPLDPLQLLTAWTWSEEFELRGQFKTLAEELADYGFEEIENNSDLLLRICASVIRSDADISTLLDVNGEVINEKFDEIKNGVKGAIEFLQRELKVEKLSNLPTVSVLIPLSVFFSCRDRALLNLSDAQRRTILNWIWKVFFSKRYSHGVTRNLNKDIEEIIKLKNNEDNSLSSFNVTLDPDYFLKTEFKMSAVNAKTFILMLARNNPKSFISGGNIDLSDTLQAYNKNEFHHIYPRAYLSDNNNSTYTCNALANFAIISRADNNSIRSAAPSVYRRNKMPDDISGICSAAFMSEDLFIADDYQNFINERAHSLVNEANRLMSE